jgi:hypothetical protein
VILKDLHYTRNYTSCRDKHRYKLAVVSEESSCLQFKRILVRLVESSEIWNREKWAYVGSSYAAVGTAVGREVLAGTEARALSVPFFRTRTLIIDIVGVFWRCIGTSRDNQPMKCGELLWAYLENGDCGVPRVAAVESISDIAMIPEKMCR